MTKLEKAWIAILTVLTIMNILLLVNVKGQQGVCVEKITKLNKLPNFYEKVEAYNPKHYDIEIKYDYWLTWSHEILRRRNTTLITDERLSAYDTSTLFKRVAIITEKPEYTEWLDSSPTRRELKEEKL